MTIIHTIFKVVWILRGGKSMRKFFITVCVFLYSANLYATSPLKDEITFFNVGQGHAVLVNKIGYTPLLIDAGSKSHPYLQGETYEWKDCPNIGQISRKILDCWQQSHGGALQGGNYHLNIIVTHPDEDHKNFIPYILSQLRSFESQCNFTFSFYGLLGGYKDLYPTGFLEDRAYYSASHIGLHPVNGSYGFLDSSGCITHLYCPKKPDGDDNKSRNKWSIVTRIQLDGISAILTGDADETVKTDMYISLGGKTNEIESDLLLVPHHGADDKTYYEPWDQAVKPQAIIIGAAPNNGQKGNGHPRGSLISKYLEGNGRLWTQRVMPHCILYRSKQELHQTIQGKFSQAKPEPRLFDKVPNFSWEHATEMEKWHLVWVDIPIYTLWTTGTLVFSENPQTPRYLDAPNGLMTYVAVPEPKYFLSPVQRDREPALIEFVTEFTINGDGDAEKTNELKQHIRTFSSEAEVFLLKESLVLKEGLSLYENRAKILNTLLEIPSSERNALFKLVKPLIQSNTRNFSARYRIFNSLKSIASGERTSFITFLREHSFIEPEDAARTAKAIETFSQFSFNEAREIMQLMQQVYPTLITISARERDSMLAMVAAMHSISPTRRISVFSAAMPFIMPHGSYLAEYPKACFHDQDDNSSLISLFKDEENLDGFSSKLQEAFQYLTNDQFPDLYRENKHFFIRALKEIPATDRINFLTKILPLFSIISLLVHHENWTLSMRAQQLAKIYGEPNFSFRIDYCIRQIQQGRFLSVRDFDGLLSFSVKYAEKKAAKSTTEATS